MKNSIRCVVLMLSLFYNPVKAGISLNDPCMLRRFQFNIYIASFPKSCIQDADCGIYYISVNACEVPIIMSKRENFEKEVKH